MRTSRSCKQIKLDEKPSDQSVDPARTALRLWIVGFLLVMIIGAIIAAHFVLPAATCIALWDKLHWLIWALLTFLVGDAPLLFVKRLFASSKFRTVLRVFAKLAQESDASKSRHALFDETD